MCKPWQLAAANWQQSARNRVAGMGLRKIRSVVASRLISFTAVACLLMLQQRASAQWWSHAPTDFEECADTAEKAATKEDKTAALADCNVRFAGRRKPGGGYAYYDFMQDRSFDIAGPNPTPQEQKYIDEQYTVYLEKQRHNDIVAALAAKQQQLEQTSLRSEIEHVPVPPQRPKLPRAKPPCVGHLFSCEWPRLSESLHELRKKLFGMSSSKAKRG
jgi:hypothetical protein